MQLASPWKPKIWGNGGCFSSEALVEKTAVFFQVFTSFSSGENPLKQGKDSYVFVNTHTIHGTIVYLPTRFVDFLWLSCR